MPARLHIDDSEPLAAKSTGGYPTRHCEHVSALKPSVSVFVGHLAEKAGTFGHAVNLRQPFELFPTRPATNDNPLRVGYAGEDQRQRPNKRVVALVAI